MAEQQQRQSVALLVTLAVAGAGWWWYATRPPAPLPSVVPSTDTVAAAVTAGVRTCTVEFEGEVARPGRYDLPAGTTLATALAAAGGATPAARLADLALNAQISADTRIYIPPRLTDGRFTSGATLTDRDLIHLPRRGATAPALAAVAGVSSGGNAAPAEPVNLNTATREQLMTLPRIGPKTADAILEYRARVGRFNSLEELRNIPRIGDKTIAAFRDRVIF